MNRTQLLQEIRIMRFEEIYNQWTEKRLTEIEAAEILGVDERTFRRWKARYESDGVDGLADKRLGNAWRSRARLSFFPLTSYTRKEVLLEFTR